MVTKYFLVRCKKCNNSMKYMTSGPNDELSKKTKRCVYCGHTFRVKEGIIKEIK
ncbi:hypothetical protein H6503_01065 [Candidatus Woesearchaeota archaeon]|nr:hypothetical protein [Candidatus Woesearchaeota archaeon]